MKTPTRILLAGPPGPDRSALLEDLQRSLPPSVTVEAGDILWNQERSPAPEEVRVFLDMDERLHLLRWLDAQDRVGGPGAIELLMTYSSTVGPRWNDQISPQSRLADLVLDGELSAQENVGRLLFYLEKKAGEVASRPRSEQSLEVDPARPADWNTLYEHYHGASPQFGRLLRASSLQIRSWGSDAASFFSPLAKRGLDFLVASLFLFFLWPIYALVAFLIYVSDPGPVFFYQTRIGQWGKPFRFPKFRTMVINAEALKDKLLARNEMNNGITFKMKRDPRIIPIGFVLRRYSLDELPQIWTVLKGKLSLVGPRPPVPREVALYSMADRRRLETVPGLTCIWQVSGRSDIPFPEQVRLDTRYIDNRSLALDIKLLAATFRAVLGAKGAY